MEGGAENLGEKRWDVPQFYLVMWSSVGMDSPPEAANKGSPLVQQEGQDEEKHHSSRFDNVPCRCERLGWKRERKTMMFMMLCAHWASLAPRSSGGNSTWHGCSDSHECTTPDQQMLTWKW